MTHIKFIMPGIILILLACMPIRAFAQKTASTNNLAGMTFEYDNLVKKCSIEFLDSTTCLVTQQFTIPEFPEEYKFLQVKCKYCIKTQNSNSKSGTLEEKMIVKITKVLSPLPSYIKLSKYVKLPTECKKWLNTFMRYPNDNSKDFFPNGVYRQDHGIRDYAPPRTFWEVDGFLLNPRKLQFNVLFVKDAANKSLNEYHVELSNDGIIWDREEKPRLESPTALQLVGIKFSSGDFIKEELFFINDSTCIYSQECECLPEGKQHLTTECLYSLKDGLLILNNKQFSAFNCLPIHQDSATMSVCIKEYSPNYKHTRYSIPGYVVKPPTLFNIIRTDTLTVTPKGELLYYKMLIPEGLDPMFIARKYKNVDSISGTSEAKNPEFEKLDDFSQRIVMNY